MAEESTNLKSAGTIAKDLGVSDAKVKKLIAELKIQPAAKKGNCSLYSEADAQKIKAAVK